jgi:cytochrome P450
VNAPLTASAAPREIDELPAPPGLPVVGNMFQIEPTRMHQILEGWRRRYGDYYRFRVGKRRFLVVGDAEAIAQSLRDRPEGFQRTERLNKAARRMGFGGVFSANGEQWKRQRPMVMAGFDPAHIKKYFPTLVKVTERFLGRWQRAAASRQSSATAIDLTADLMRYTVDVVGGLAFGSDINTIESDEEVIQRHLDKVLPALAKSLLSPFPWLRKLPLPSNRLLDGHLEALRAAVEGFIAEARKRIEANPRLREEPDNLIEAMVAARDREGSGLTDQDVSGNVLTMLLAGEDTTANTLAWMIYLLSRHPAHLARARDEVRAKLGNARLPTREQLEELTWIEACMNETMRVKPVAPMIIQQAVRETVLAGVRVPKDYLVVLLMRGPTMEDRHFGNAAAFDPARWLDAALTPSSSKRVAMPFGAGPRLCPGRYLAMLEMKMVMAMLLRNFDIRSVTTPDGKEARESLNLTMAPVGLQLRLQLAQSAA